MHIFVAPLPFDRHEALVVVAVMALNVTQFDNAARLEHPKQLIPEGEIMQKGPSEMLR